jgi:hypothetical protein
MKGTCNRASASAFRDCTAGIGGLPFARARPGPPGQDRARRPPPDVPNAIAVQDAADRDAAGAPRGTAGRRLHQLSPCWQAVQMSEQTYDEKRARRLEEMLRALAERIRELDARGELLRHAGELTKRIGDVRSELFHYEVRATYDTPEVAESRKIIEKAKQTDTDWEQSEWAPDEDDEPTW